MTALLLATVYFGIIGAATMVAVGCDSHSRAEWLAKAYLYGLGTVGLSGQLLGAIGWRLTPRYFLGLLALAAAVVLFRRWRIPVAAARPRPEIATLFGVALLMIPLAVVLIETVVCPLTDYDGRITWMLKARAIAREHTIAGPFFRGEASRDAHSHYPLLIPVAAASMLELTGSDDDHSVRPVFAFAAIGLVCLLGAALRAVASPPVAAVVAAAVAWLPQVAVGDEGGMFSGYAEVPLLAFVSLALLSVLRREALAQPAIFGLQLAFIVCTKNEGLVFAAILFALALARECVSTRAIATRAMVVVFCLAVTVTLLVHWHAQIPLEHDENYPRLLLALPSHLNNYPRAAAALLSRMLYWRSWGLFWLITGIATVVALADKTRRRLAAALLASVVVIVGVYVTTYTVTNWTISDLAVSSANRLLMHLLPFAAVILAIGGESVRRAGPTNASRS